MVFELTPRADRVPVPGCLYGEPYGRWDGTEPPFAMADSVHSCSQLGSADAVSDWPCLDEQNLPDGDASTHHSAGTQLTLADGGGGASPWGPPLPPNSGDARVGVSAHSAALLDAFHASRSRVVRIFDAGSGVSGPGILAALLEQGSGGDCVPRPVSMWPARPDAEHTPESGVLALYASHEEACAALASPVGPFSAAPAIDRDFEIALDHPRNAHHQNASPPLRRPLLVPAQSAPEATVQLIDLHMLEQDSAPGLVCHGIDGPYTISSNPPNPKTSFRAGDWICSATNCAAHNFGRNSTCIACGRPRAADSHGMLARGPTYPAAPSPRFAAAQHDELLRAPLTRMHSAPSLSTAAAHAPLVGSGARGAGASLHPLLTPSGRALSVGGRVQNVSSDPLAPCIMYWPDNEPLPEQGQIRPLGSAVITYPPIINTGNKGAAEKQPGDWVCQKCHYHNWRRRKVCQTCYPYAEGNGDSISAAVQAERIALLENVLATQVDCTRRQGSWPPVLSLAPASAGMHSAPPSAGEMRAPLSPLSPVSPLGPAPWQIEVRRTSLALAQDLRAPIYQTGGGHSSVHSNLSVAAHGLNGHNNNFDSRSISNHGMSHHSHGLSSAGLGSVYARELNALRPQPGATFLPSFLQDMVQSPSLSPSTSTSSADLSLEEGHDVRFGRDMAGLSAGLGGLNISGGGNGLKISGASRGRGAESTFALSGGSIWQMDGEESKTLATTPTAASVMRAPRVAVARPGSLERTH